MTLPKRLFYFFVALILCQVPLATEGLAQGLPTPVRMLTQMPPRTDIPPNLLKERSVLVISARANNKGQLDPARSREWAEVLQKMFAERGVDVVACFDRLTLLAGREPWAAFESLLLDREVRHLLWLQELPNGSFRLSMAELPAEAPLLRSSVEAYSREQPDVESLAADVRREIIRANPERENFMVLETPEFFDDVPMITKGRYESFPLDLRTDKIAIRWPDDMSEESKRAFGLHLDSLYPYTFNFVSASLTDKQVQDEGFQYVLDWVYAPGIALRRIFNYEITEGENSFVTFMTLGPNQTDIKKIHYHIPVYKFYMRHLITGDLYLGKDWDADVTWTESLKHFVYNYRGWAATQRR